MQSSPPAPLRVLGKRVLDGVGVVEGVSNSYLVEDGGSTYVIDTGFYSSAKEVIRAIREAGANVENLKGILLTHDHSDHFGGAARLRWLSGAPVTAHRVETPGLEGFAPTSAPFLMRVLFHRHPVKVDNLVEDGATVGPFTVYHLPGHTPGSIAFFHKARGLLFTGDALIVGRSGKLNISKPSYCYDPQGAVTSLKRLSSLTGVNAILTGHGGWVTEGAQEALSETIERLNTPKALHSPTFFGPEGRPELHPGTPGWRER